jgi:predicted RNase H-like nuclease (RuvC/YqgF family)
MSDIITQILLALVAAGFFTDVVKGIRERRKITAAANLDDANSVQVLVGSATTMLQPLKDRVAELEREAKLLRTELSQARGEVQRYSDQLHTASHQLEIATAENQRITRENRQLRTMLAGGNT